MRFQLFDSERGCLQRRRSQRLEKNIRHRLIDGKTAHVETFPAMARVAFLTLTVVAGRGIRALISDMQPPATAPTDGQALQQCRSFSQSETCLVESRRDVRLQSHLIGFEGGPIDETFMMSGKKHQPLFMGQMTNS